MRALFSARSMGTGLVYGLDPRTKMGISLLSSVAVVVFNRPEPLALLLVAALAYALTLRRPKALLICYGFILVMWTMAYGFMHLMQFFLPGPGSTELVKLGVPFLRTAVMVNVIMVMALSTPIQTVLTTLKTLRLHRTITIPAAVMIRFVPTFMSDIRQVMETLKTRGYALTPLFVLAHPVLTSRLVFVPLVFRALRASDELGIAAELKGLGYAQRVYPCRPLHFGRQDWIVAGAALICVSLGLVLQTLGSWPQGGGI